jgi:HPt (histidine-containing phosphotransfer) domain-containing protein
MKGGDVMIDSPKGSKVLVSGLCDDADMVELVEMFVEELQEKVAAIERSLAEQDFETLGRLAHQLKGSAGGYGFPAITDAAGDVEASINARRSLDTLAEEVKGLTSLCGLARATTARE